MYVFLFFDNKSNKAAFNVLIIYIEVTHACMVNTIYGLNEDTVLKDKSSHRL